MQCHTADEWEDSKLWRGISSVHHLPFAAVDYRSLIAFLLEFQRGRRHAGMQFPEDSDRQVRNSSKGTLNGLGIGLYRV